MSVAKRKTDIEILFTGFFLERAMHLKREAANEQHETSIRMKKTRKQCIATVSGNRSSSRASRRN